MKAFARLFHELDTSNKTTDKLEALRSYFAEAPAADAVWAVWFFTGHKLDLKMPSRRLRSWAAQLSGHPDWMVEECYERVGDLAETAALLLPLSDEKGADELPLHVVIADKLLPLRDWGEGFQLALLQDFWLSLSREACFVVNKMMTGGLRVGVSRQLLIRALADHLGIERSTLTHRLMGEWQPTEEFFRSLNDDHANAEARRALPYPFYLASPLDSDPAALGDPADWYAEWKWDGLRAQLLRRGGETHLWSRGDERLTEPFPEIREAAATLPDGTVLDGEVVCWKDGRPLKFHFLQRRIGRKDLAPEVLTGAPAVFLAYDCLELEGADLRAEPLEKRRQRLEGLLPEENILRLSPRITFENWDELHRRWPESRARGVEGIMLKGRNGPYRVGRVRADWWKWKVEPYRADLVLVYAQAGHGRRANLFTDYTLAAWEGERLVPVAKAYSGLTDEELRGMDRWIKSHTLARRGPVRTVPAEQVFEIAFEDLRPSTRHKSGLAMRFPRILRWRKDKPPAEAETVERLRALLDSPAPPDRKGDHPQESPHES